jgi:hypothetical protein
MRPLFIWTCLALFASVGCGMCGKKKEQPNPTLPGNPPIQVPEDQPVAGEFKSSVAQGVRRFVAPHAEEITSVSSAPDGSLLAAVTAKNLYLFDDKLEPITTVALPGLPPMGRQVVALSRHDVAVWNVVPSAQVETRILHVFHTIAKPGPGGKSDGWNIEESRIAGDVAFGAAVAGRLVLVVREPATVAVLGLHGDVLGQHEIAGNPQRIDVSAEGNWAAIASAGTPGGYGGVLTVEVTGRIGDDQAPLFATVNLGKGALTPLVAIPLDDAVLVAGAAESDHPVAVVAPRATGELRARIPLGQGKVMGAARSESGKRAVVFVNEPQGEKETAYHAFVLDTATWTSPTSLAAGPDRLANRPLVLGEKVMVADCHAAPVLDLAAGSADPGMTFPAPGIEACIAGLWKIGDRAAAREGRQVVTWPLPK